MCIRDSLGVVLAALTKTRVLHHLFRHRGGVAHAGVIIVRVGTAGRALAAAYILAQDVYKRQS